MYNREPCDAFCVPVQSFAQDYPVSVVETGKTPGFESPVLYLNKRIVARRLLSKLSHNRTLHEPYLINQDEDFGEVGEPINRAFMVNMIRSQVEAFNRFADSYDDSKRPSPGCAWQLKIFHPGSSPGELSPEAAPCHIIVFCIGATGSTPALYDAMDWLGNYYAQRGYIVAIPVFIGNDDGLTELPFYEIAPDIYSMQVSQAIDYIRASFKGTLKRAVNSKKVTVIGHSFGGFVAQKTAAQDRRIARLCIFSSVFGYQHVLARLHFGYRRHY